ncbi:MAG: hypothetical protein NVSMB32_07360 [Actinomycetota bacterium]
MRIQATLLGLWQRLLQVLADPEGFSTAELLGNAALAIAALVAIWAVMRTLGLDIVTWMRGQLSIR